MRTTPGFGRREDVAAAVDGYRAARQFKDEGFKASEAAFEGPARACFGGSARHGSGAEQQRRGQRQGGEDTGTKVPSPTVDRSSG